MTSAATKRQPVVAVKLPTYVRVTTIVYFCSAGSCGLLGINALITLSPLLEENLWPSVRFSDTLMLCCQSGSFITGIAFLNIRGAALNHKCGDWIAGVTIASFMLYCVPPLLIDADDPLASAKVGKGLYMVLSFLTGVGAATAQMQGYAYCGICTAIPDASKLVTLGFAMSGLYVWMNFAFARRHLFPSPKLHHHNVLAMTYVSWLCGAAHLALRLCFRVMLRQLPGFRSSIDNARAGGKPKTRSSALLATHVHSVSINSTLDDDPRYYGSLQSDAPPISVVPVVHAESSFAKLLNKLFYNDTWILYRSLVTVSLTFFVFPSIGPYSWPVLQKHYYVGVFQVGDLFGRLYVSMYVCSDYAVNALIAFRAFIVIPLYLIVSIFPSTPVLTSTTFLIILSVCLTVTHSLSFASAAVHAVRLSKGDALKSEMIATRLSLSCVLGLLIGIAVSKLFLRFAATAVM
eukprot:Lankesteria_metandrocarpae@DN588_c0_g1_i1.p1